MPPKDVCRCFTPAVQLEQGPTGVVSSDVRHIPFSSIRLLDSVGKGGMGTVRKAQLEGSEGTVAVEISNVADARHMCSAWVEVGAMLTYTACKARHVMPLLGVCTTPQGTVYSIMLLCSRLPHLRSWRSYFSVYEQVGILGVLFLTCSIASA